MLQIVYTLTGSASIPPILDRQLDDFVSKLTSRLEDIIWEARLRGIGQFEKLYHDYAALGQTERLRLFLSPSGYSAVHEAFYEKSEATLSSLIAECAKARDSNQQPASDLSAKNMSEDDMHLHMLLGGTIHVDLGSDACRRIEPTSPVFYSAYEDWSQSELLTVAEKLKAAFDEIETIAPSFARLIRNYTRRIYIRKVGELAPASEQVDTEIGGIRMRNVHLDSYDHEQLVDDLIHESVHNFLSSFELLNFPFMVYGGENDPNARPVSPWSMRPIRMLPFLHAAFVYFSLLHYAMRKLQAGGLREDQLLKMQKRRNKYASGFLMPGNLRSYAEGHADIDPRVLQTLDWMEEIVVQTCGRAQIRASEGAGDARPSLAQAELVHA